MLKKLSILSAVFCALLLWANPAAKIPAKTPLALYANLSDVINYPLAQQFLAGIKLPPEIKLSDFNGKIAAGISFNKKNAKEFYLNVIFKTAKPTAGKVFALIAGEAEKQGAKRFKVAGKMAVGDQNARCILMSSKELILQAKASPKAKFANLKAAKNILVNRPELKNNTLVIVADTAKLPKNSFNQVQAQFRELMTIQQTNVLAVKLEGDGAIAISSLTTHRTAEDCQKTLQAYQQQTSALKQDPAAAAILDKLQVSADGTVFSLKASFTMEEIQSAIIQIMTLMSNMNNANTNNNTNTGNTPAAK